MDTYQYQSISNFIKDTWQSSITEELENYIKIPCKSPAFDNKWQENKFLDAAVTQFKTWVLAQNIPNLSLEVVVLPNRTPLLYIEIAANCSHQETILLYGHLDKQPEMIGWDEDKAPWKPVIIDNKLYGRGAADDGYALFGALTAINALNKANLAHPRCVIIIEACEESGSYDLPYYVDHLKNKIKEPSLVICLDSGCGNYDQFWLTTSLRGNIRGVLNVEVIKEGVHSGASSGIVPSSFRIARQLLNRIENEKTGEILLKELYCNIPSERIEQAKNTALILGNNIYKDFPFHDNVEPVTLDNVELLLNRTWRPQLAITGAGGLPDIPQAGNVMRPITSLVLSMRIPPMVNAKIALEVLKNTLEKAPPYNSKISFVPEALPANGWNAPVTTDWLQSAVDSASTLAFHKPSASWGEGGTIPFMAMLGEKFPKAQFVITGVLGPHSNAHGPNEFLHLPMAEKITGCVAYIINKFCNN